MIEKYGMKLNDTVLAEPHQMGLYDDLMSKKAELAAGGGAQNSARGAQYMLPEKSVWYVGCVGDDEYAELLRRNCKEQGVHTEYRVDKEKPTGRCGVIITDHHRTMCTDLAAANEYKLEHLQQPQIWSMVESSKVYYVGGYHLTVCVPAAMAVAKHAAETNKPFLLGLSAGFIPQFFKDQLAEIVPYADYVFGNENEAKAWAESQGMDASTTVAQAAQKMAEYKKVNSKRPRTVIITQGTEPTLVAVQGEDKVREYPVLSIDSSKINDTTGAGDAFAGGFLAGVVSGEDVQTCVQKGQWLAKLSIQELGAAYPQPKQTFSK
ncbi:adenosine kinase [Elasticomyces elasticus]|nr:adenosine kinase [Elasticomyces elasticus]